MYRLYMAESLWGLSHGRTIEARYPELLKPRPPADTRTAQEIIDDITEKARA